MYSDRKKTHTGLIVLLCALVLLGLLLLLVFCDSSKDVGEEGAAAIRETVRRSAMQCYAVEGVYPPDLQYLKDNYGLQVNTEDYYVVYDVFASNLPPTVRVIRKNAE